MVKKNIGGGFQYDDESGHLVSFLNPVTNIEEPIGDYGYLTPQQAAVLQNINASRLPKWRAAVGKVRSGTANARILCLGDSTTLGVWSAGGLTTGNMKPNAYPWQLANMLNAVGINAHANSFFGVGKGGTLITAPSNAVNDSRVTFGSGWAALATETVGGNYIIATGTTGNLAFTPTMNVDTFNIFYPIKTSGFGKFNANINGGAATVFNQTGGASTSAYTVGTLTTTLGNNTLNINFDTAPNAVIGGVEAYDSSKKWVSVMNAGRSGARASDLLAGDVMRNLPGLGADLHIINLGVNDWLGAVSVATFRANIQSIITTCKATGDVVLVSPFPSQVGGTYVGPAQSVQDQYVAALQELAISNNVPLVDVYNRFSSYSVSNANGMYGDGAHPNAIGYADAACAIFNAIVMH